MKDNYYERLLFRDYYANKLGNLIEMDKLLEIYNVPRQNI